MFNHMFDMAFSLESAKEDASDVTPEMLIAALRNRIDDLEKMGSDAVEAFSLCDSYEVGV